MNNTTTTASRPRRVARLRVGLLGGAIVVGGLAVCTIGSALSAAGPATDRRICTWRPVADELALGPGLLGTVRLQGDRVEVLHQVTCSDGTYRNAWMAAID